MGLVEMAFFRKIVEWWQGRLVPMRLEEPEGGFPILSGGYRIRPWPARVWVWLRKLGWERVASFVSMVCAIIMTVLALRGCI